MSEEKKTTKEIVDEQAKLLMNSFIFRTLEDNQEIYYYHEESGLYVLAERMIEGMVESMLDKDATNHILREVIGKIKRSTYIPRSKANQVNLIPLRNCIFDIERMRAIDYSPDHFFTSKHPVDYSPTAICPKINTFIDQITEGDIEKGWLLEKIAAYAFYRAYPIQKAFMLLGSGSNGKSVYLSLVRKMLGDENVCAIQLQDFSNNRFAAGKLYGKNANIFADLESHSLDSAGLFKSLTGGDTITCDQKFKNSFEFMNTAKLLFSCNQLPETKDESDAFFRRWVIVEFTKKFEMKEQNTNLLNEVTSSEEISGFFNQLIPKLKELLEENRFTDETTDEIREKYMRNANSALAFLQEYVEITPDAETPKPLLWKKYNWFCVNGKTRLPAVSDKRFWQFLHSFFGEKIYEMRGTLNPLTGERQRVIRGIQLISDEETPVNHLVTSTRELSKQILEQLKKYEGDGAPLVPYLFLFEKEWKDIPRVKEIISQMKRSGILFEPRSGYLQINKLEIVNEN